MIKACVFDMDGTVTNTIPTIANTMNTALQKNGLPAISEDRYLFLVGNGVKLLAERSIAEVDGDSSLFDAVYADYMELYKNDYTSGSYVYDGIKELTDELKRRGVKIGLFSNRPHSQTVAVLDSFFGENYFDSLRGAVDGYPLKPDPTVLHEIYGELGITADECAYIGDTSTDMQTGKNGGAFTIGVTWGFRPRQELIDNHADAIVDSPDEILKYIK